MIDGNAADVMIVDDNAENLRVLSRMLRELEYKVRPASSGRVALRAAREKVPDLVLLDVSMPEINGYEVCRELKADPRLASVPVIFVSALSEPFDKLRGFEVGAVDYITKPFNVAEVAARVRTHVQIRRLQRALEQQTKRLEAANNGLSAFGSAVCHELRAPARHMRGFAELLAEREGDRLSEKGNHYVDRITAAGERLETIIDDIWRLARVTGETLAKSHASLSKIAGEVVDDLRQRDPSRDVEVVIQPGLDAHVDQGLIRTALVNLLGNAWKFTSKTAHARIEFYAEQTESADVRYVVTDNGAGFSHEHESQLWVPFGRLHVASEFPGTGVGLASVQRIIYRHGGDVGATGVVGEGAVFWFTLPR